MNDLSIGAPAPSYLTFQDQKLTIVDNNGQIWVTSSDVARALGYERSDFVNRIYNRHSGEFTDQMTITTKLTDTNGCSGSETDTREIRIFSLRGAHLVAMLTRTPKAAEFRRWVLDLLDREATQPMTSDPSTPKALPAPQKTLDAETLARIERRAWSLAHDAYEQIREEMTADVTSKRHRGAIETWHPKVVDTSVFSQIEAAAVLCDAFSRSIRAEGQKLAAKIGTNYEVATKNMR